MAETTLNPEPIDQLQVEARDTLTLAFLSLVFMLLAVASMFPLFLLIAIVVALWAACKGLFVVGAREASSPQRRRALGSIVLAAPCLVLSVLVLPESLHYSCHNRERSKQSRSLNNLKQLAIGVQSYAQDYDGHLPGWVRTPDGHLTHNVWDEQIRPHLKSEHVISNNDTGIRSYSDPQRKRTVTYGLNGLLITPRKRFDGTADWSVPKVRKLEEIGDPANVILFAELNTEQPVPGIYAQRPDPLPSEGTAQPSDQWKSALNGWIDIDPRAFVETSGPKDSYTEGKWDSTRGIARDMYGGGGCYAFVDGHVKFMKLSQTVRGHEDIPPEQYWSSDNPHNMWNPDR